MPIRRGGIFANRPSTSPRDHFCRSTIAPRPSWPTMWNEFLPISIPTTAKCPNSGQDRTVNMEHGFGPQRFLVKLEMEQECGPVIKTGGLRYAYQEHVGPERFRFSRDGRDQ